MNTIYSLEMYYQRIIAFLRRYRPNTETHPAAEDLYTFFRSMWYLGLVEPKSRGYYWKLVKGGLSKYRQSFYDAVTMAIYGYHFHKLAWSPDFSFKWPDWLHYKDRILDS